MISLQRNGSRSKVIDDQVTKHRNDSPNVWKEIYVVFYLLNGNGRDTADGASEDESEVDEETKRKSVRVLRRDWINKAIPKLMHAVDTYGQSMLDDVGHQHQGNVSHPRSYHSSSGDKRPYMTGLPRNFYDESWYRSLDEVDKELVEAKEQIVPIPTLVSFAFVRRTLHAVSDWKCRRLI